jgi:SAM-dependent methyltransferase
MSESLPDPVSITASDLNQGMLDQAAAVGTPRPVEWRKADAMQLPFADEAFDAVVCQFGVMFFPDKGKAFAEARRVLRPGGALLFSTWDRIEDNEIADAVTDALAERYPADPPRFMARTPHGYTDRDTILRDVASGGFSATPSFTTLAERSRADSARSAAVAYCQGTPLRNEIEARDPGGLIPATDHATAAVARRFGPGPIDARIQAHVIVVEA